MIRVGITGQSGFIGTHLAKGVCAREDMELVPFEDVFFSDQRKLCAFVRQCDVIMHLAAMSRCSSEEELYQTNVGLVQKLIDALESECVKPHVLFSSSIHEARETAYGKAKREGRRLFEEWANRVGASFTGFVFPNVYGPGARVFYCSFVANFAYQLNHGEEPTIQVDAPIKLIYIKHLCQILMDRFLAREVAKIDVPWDLELRVSEVLEIFRSFKNGARPSGPHYMNDLYETFISYR